VTRTYDMSTRESARRQTREQILDAAVELFTGSAYEDVTLADVARLAGVSTQTVVNHFGSKVGLYTTGIAERWAPEVTAVRDRAVPGDVASIVEVAVEDYERTGDTTYRTLALAERLEELRPLVDGGHRSHAAWVATVLAPRLRGLREVDRERSTALGRVVLDVTTWHHLRRVQQVDVAATRDHLARLLEGVLPPTSR
jgi:AcrR family transcriptional regulator